MGWKGSEFYNNFFENFLKINNIDMYSTYNERKFAVAERFIRALKNKIFKHLFKKMFILMCLMILSINTITQSIKLYRWLLCWIQWVF